MSELVNLDAYRAVTQGVQEFVFTRFHDNHPQEGLAMDDTTQERPTIGRPKKPATVAVTIRMPQTMLAQVDTYIADLAARLPGLTLERSRGIVLMLQELLTLKATPLVLPAAEPGPAPDTTTTTPARRRKSQRAPVA